MATATYQQQLDFIASKLPLEVPLFEAGSLLRLSKTIVFKKIRKSVHGNFDIVTGGNKLFFIWERSPAYFQHCGGSIMLLIPLDVVHEIAQNPANGTIMWLLWLRGSVSQFWQSPLCEPRLMGIIAGFAALPGPQPPHYITASIPPGLDPRSPHS